MQSFLNSFERKNKKQFLKFKKYIRDNDWSVPETEVKEDGNTLYKYFVVKSIKDRDGTVIYEGKEPEFVVQNKIALNILDRLKYFTKHVEGDIGKNVKVDRLIKNMLAILTDHTNRIDKFLQNDMILISDTTELQGVDKDERELRSEDIDFENKLHKNHSKITDELRALNLERKNEDSLLELLNGAPAPLSMRWVIEKEYPDIKRRMKAMGIDDKSPPKNEMLIHMDEKDIPEYNPDKHFFDQDKKTLQFYVDEYKKMRDGIVIDGVYISGQLYCHLNVFKTPIPTPYYNQNSKKYEVKDVIKNPPLRDNEWFILQDNYEKAKENGEMLFLAATRRAAKTTLIALHLIWKAQTGGKKLLVAGGSSKDLGQIEDNFKTAIQNMDPAFRMPNTTNDWTKKVVLGVKKKNQKNIELCTLHIINLVSGTEKVQEIFAGFTPDAVVIDECMKHPFQDQLDGLKPALDTPYGKRCVVILSGTGNTDDSVTKDAQRLLKSPDKRGIHQMDWDSLERGLDKEDITWKRMKFGTFLPAQMSAKEGMIKIESNLANYLGVESEELSKILIQVTDWKSANNLIQGDRKDLEGDSKGLKKEKVYYPIDPREIFLSGKTNPFPRERIRIWKEQLESVGDVGKPVELVRNKITEKVEYVLSNKPYPILPHVGGFIDAPATIYEDPIDNPPYEFYVAGFDGYKQEEADSDSLGSLTIIRRDTGKVVASYHSRPDPKNYFHEQCYMLLEMYNAPVFMENEDMDFKGYCDRRKTTFYYIVKGQDLLGDLTLNVNQRRPYGWQPTTKNKSYFLGILIGKTKEHLDTEDEDGSIETKRGYEDIKDQRILGEMIGYNDIDNFDTIISCMSAYAYDFYLTTVYGAPKKPAPQKEEAENHVRKYKPRRSMYPNQRNRSMYPRKR